MSKVCSLVVAVITASFAFPQSWPTAPRLIADINSLPRRLESSYVAQLTVVGAATFFEADDGVHGRELWRTLGTSATTQLVFDLRLGVAGSQVQFLAPIRTGHGYEAFFFADDGSHGLRPYVTQGAPGQAPLLLDPTVGPRPLHPIAALALDTKVLFFADDGVHGHEVWITDGTVAGTFMLPEFFPGRAGFNNLQPPFIFARRDATGSSYAVIAVPGTTSCAFWRTDGTAAGTVPFASIAWGSGHALGKAGTLPGGPTVFTMSLGSASPSGWSIFTCDGTSAGTHFVHWIALTTNIIVEPIVFDGRVWFGATPQNFAVSSNGTAAGTIFHQLTSGPPSQISHYCGVIEASLWCVGVGRDGLIRFDPGAVNGVVLPVPGLQVTGSFTSREDAFAVGRSIIYFNREHLNVYAIDIPSLAVTMLTPRPDGNSFENHVVQGSRALFPLDTSAGDEPVLTDGTQAGTSLLANINDETQHPPNASSYLNGFDQLHGRAIFGAWSPLSSYDTWQSDGNPANTSILLRGWYRAPGLHAAEVSSGLFFGVRTAVGYQLAFSDGTTGGTYLVPSSQPVTPVGVSGIRLLGDLALYFEGYGTAKVWASDPNSTWALPIPQLALVERAEITSIGERAIVTGMSRNTVGWAHFDLEISTTDGTAGGSRVVTTTQAQYSSFSRPPADPFAAFADRMWFRAYDAAAQINVLWKSDGTAAGTHPFGVPALGPSAEPDMLVPAGTKLYVVAGGELWITDGSAPLTRLATLFVVGRVVRAVALGERILLRTDQNELWVSDGTSGGTQRLQSFALQTATTAMVTTGARYAFFAAVAAGGQTNEDQLWITDGTVAGTRPFAPRRVTGSEPGRLVAGQLFLWLEDPIAGLEPHVVDPGASVEVVTPGCGGTRAPDLVALDDPVLGSVMRLRGRTAAGSIGVLLISLSTSAPNPTLPSSPCRFAVDPRSFGISTPFALSSTSFPIQIPIPPDPGLRGLSATIQFAAGPTDASVGLDVSTGLRLTLGW